MAATGLFVVLDGIDGCGKSTQAARLVSALETPGRPTPLHLREPGSTRIGERIRELLLSKEFELEAPVETLLFAAARRQMLEECVRPALERGGDVVCERFHPATFAYQAVAGGLDEDALLRLLGEWAEGPSPDLEVILVVDPERAAERNRGAELDRIEARGLEFQRAVAAGFERYVERTPRAVAVDGEGDPEEIARRILVEVERARP